METYSFPTTDTKNARVAPSKLDAAIKAAGLSTEGVIVQDTKQTANGEYEGGTIDVLFPAKLDPADEAVLRALVADHVGSPTVSTIFKATAEVVHSETAITEQDWQDLGGVVTTIEYFVPNLKDAIARVVGSYKAVGDGAQLRILEGEGADERVLSVEFALDDTLDEWTLLKTFNSNEVPSSGQKLFRLQGRLNGAASASVRYTSMTLLELDR